MMRDSLLSVLLMGFVGTAAALAQVPDPTRPPEALLPSASEAGAGAAAEAGVQTVILRHGGKSGAVINGQYVVVGGKLGDKRVLKISESEVVLEGGSGREVIKVTPAIEKMPAKNTAVKKQRMRERAEK